MASLQTWNSSPKDRLASSRSLQLNELKVLMVTLKVPSKWWQWWHNPGRVPKWGLHEDNLRDASVEMSTSGFFFIFNNTLKIPLGCRHGYQSEWAKCSNKQPPKSHWLNKNLFLTHVTCPMQANNFGEGWGYVSAPNSYQGTQAKGQYDVNDHHSHRKGCDKSITDLYSHCLDTLPYISLAKVSHI